MNRNKSTKKTLLTLFTAACIFLSGGLIFQYLYQHSPENPFNRSDVENTINLKIKTAEIATNKLIEDSTCLYPAKIQKIPGISFYIYSGRTLKFWSTNQLEINPEKFTEDTHWHYDESGNVCVIGRWFVCKNSDRILTIIPIKHKFQIENKYLSNSFFPAFNLDKNISICGNHAKGHEPFYDANGKFLFCLHTEKQSIYNEQYSIAGFISFAIFYLLILAITWITGKNILKKNQLIFHFLSVAYFVLILLLCYYNFPGIFFSNQLFSPGQFTVNSFLNSYIHLTIIILYILTYFLTYTTSGKSFNFVSGSLLLILLVLLNYYLLRSLIFHSGINFNILNIKEINLIQIWAHLLLFLSGYIIFIVNSNLDIPGQKLKIFLLQSLSFILIALLIALLSGEDFYAILLTGLLIISNLTHYITKNKIADSWHIAQFIILMTLGTLFITLAFNEQKKDIRYKVLSENILINGNEENDPIALLLMEEMQKNIADDSLLFNLMSKNDSLSPVKSYIFEKYLKGFWNNFDVEIFRMPDESIEYQQYKNFLEFSGKEIKQTGFYTLPASLYDLSIAGIIKPEKNKDHIKQNDVLILEFRPKRIIRSYSFPDLLISKEAALLRHHEISIARFEKNQLVYHDNRYAWDQIESLFDKTKPGYTKMHFNNEVFYIFSDSENKIVIRETSILKPWAYILYVLAVLLSFLLCWKIIDGIRLLFTPDKKISIGLTNRFQLVFIILLIISFIGILIFSIRYFRSNYQQEQTNEINKKKSYIQQSLQDTYFWTQNLNDISEQSLNNILTELAFRYETDINVYNTNGVLMGSSQSLIFQKKLISPMMSPKAYFWGSGNVNQYEEIGNLQYLTAYADMINGDYLRIGYIAIPQYLSQTEINAKIESFLLSIIQIYLIIIILSLFFILIAGKQLAVPLRQLELKLRSMKIGGKNEKIDYQYDDEIGHLVEQYNKTVDELAKSTSLLIQSERETAWRTMARQIAHEINNPLTPMKLTIQQLQRTKEMQHVQWDEYFEKATKTLIEQIDNLSRIAGTFSQFARLPETVLTVTDLASKLSSTVDLFALNRGKININYIGEKSGVYVLGDGEQLIQVFNNLLKNAIQAIPESKKGIITVHLSTLEDDVEISFEDNGTGINDKDKESVFKPNFTTKSTGMGLGLSITKNIIENMQGTITFSSVAGQGSTFTVRLKKSKNT